MKDLKIIGISTLKVVRGLRGGDEGLVLKLKINVIY